LLLALAGVLLPAQETELPPTFGTTVVVPGGLEGRIYRLPKSARRLPLLEKLKPVGTIYTASLDVPPRDFREGFPGVTGRLEWFAIDYTGRFWVEKPGEYTFALTSDDGAILWIDDYPVINNDGTHPPQTALAQVTLAGGVHTLRVAYFQGPQYEVALKLEVAAPDEPLRVFSTDEFKPPANPEDWRFPEARPRSSWPDR
jgi:hypothetical protein